MELSVEIILKMASAVAIAWFVGRYPFAQKKGCCISVLRGGATLLVALVVLFAFPPCVIIGLVALGGLNVIKQMKKKKNS
jgi:hypothetical protein